MAVKDFPDISPDSEEWSLRYNTQSYTSDLTGAQQTREQPGARWSVTMRFNNRWDKDARALQAFLVSLRGRAGRFFVTPADWKPLGTAGGSPTLSVAATAGDDSVSTTGWDASQPEALLPGDYVEINGELKKVTQTVSADTNGDAVVNFAPPLRKDAGAGIAVVVDDPACTMMLEADDTAQWAIQAGMIYSLTLNGMEPLDI